MINHHPKFELLQAFVNGELPASMSVAIAIHADVCPSCQQHIANLTEQVAENSFEQQFLHKFVVDGEQDTTDNITPFDAQDFDSMFEQITSDETIDIPQQAEQKEILFKGESYVLPQQLQHIDIGNIVNLGQLARSRLELNEGEIHTNLLHIEPGGSVPEHTHKGFEITLLLAGSFKDNEGSYNAGDFIMLDSSNTHQPTTDEGCLCLTIANDSLHFTQGVSRILNPIGTFIY
jgi:putative transcriptional regulator